MLSTYTDAIQRTGCGCPRHLRDGEGGFWDRFAFTLYRREGGAEKKLLGVPKKQPDKNSRSAVEGWRS